jgi:ubiquitin C-terminal hydrolase
MIASMLLSNVKYQDPTLVLESIVDDFGNKISIYEQQDIGEFFLNFLDRLQDGLCENKNAVRKILGNDLASTMRKMSMDSNNN